MHDRPVIVCLCGSTRFGDAFRRANYEETLAGKIVLTIGCDMKSDDALFDHLSEEEKAEIKAELDELHLRKIDLADEVLILNVGGYIGESTRRELGYARAKGKAIRYLEWT
jgi:nucleoside 2-deoxyribosyltransferase